MNDKNNPLLTKRSQCLRKNMTQEERHLWYDFLKSLPYTFNRQKVIGNYIADFYCAKAKLVIELDGSQHYTDEMQKKDQKRDQYFHSLGISVLRFSNPDVKNHFEAICQMISETIEAKTEKASP